MYLYLTSACVWRNADFIKLVLNPCGFDFDCMDRKVVQYIVNITRGRNNATDAYLSYLQKYPRTFSSYQEFVERTVIFQESLKVIDDLNQILTTSYVSGPSL